MNSIVNTPPQAGVCRQGTAGAQAHGITATMTAKLLLPSKALNGRFELPDNPPKPTVAETSGFRGHGFMIGDIGLLLSSTEVSEIASGLPLCRLPNTPRWLLGMVNLRGNILPVFELQDLLGYESETNADPKMLFVRLGDEWVGMTSNGLPIQVQLNDASRLRKHPTLPPMLQPYVRACYKDTQFWVDWDIAGFFNNVADRLHNIGHPGISGSIS